MELLQEVAIAMGKQEVDDEVVDKASDVLKMLKAKEMLQREWIAQFVYGH